MKNVVMANLESANAQFIAENAPQAEGYKN